MLQVNFVSDGSFVWIGYWDGSCVFPTKGRCDTPKWVSHRPLHTGFRGSGE